MGALRVLLITSEWPTPELPYSGIFVKRQVEALRNEGVDIDVFSFRGSKKPFNYARAWRDVRRRISSKDYNLIHAHWGQSGLLALPKRLPLVVTFHGHDIQGWVGRKGQRFLPTWTLGKISRVVARQADEVIIVSDHLSSYFPNRLYNVIPMGIDTSLFHPMPQAEARKQLGMSEGKPLILFPASPERKEKRYELAQSALARLYEKYGAELIVCKDVPQEKMPIYMNASDAMLITSLYEGSPTVVKEALACNLPIVSVDVGDVRERIEGIDGCVVSMDDSSDSIAAALTTVLKRGGRVDGRKAAESFDETLLAKQVVSVYKRAVSQS